MSDPSTQRRQARQDARDLIKVAQEIVTTVDAKRARDLAIAASKLAGTIRGRLASAADWHDDAIRATVADGLEPVLQAYAAQLSEDLPGVNFSLIVFHDGLLNYVSNAVRDDVVAALREFVAAHDAGPKEEPHA